MNDSGGEAPRNELRRRLLSSIGDQAGRPAPPDPLVQPTNAAEQAEPFPMLDLQKAYWLGRALAGVACHGYLELDGEDLDPARLEAAFNQLITRHPALRSVFTDDGRQRTLPAEHLHYKITVADLRTKVDRDGALAEIRNELSHQQLPADRWPLFDVRISRVSRRRWRLHLSIDILIADAQSFQILARELLFCYADPNAELPPIDLTFRDYVLATRVGDDELARAEMYWGDRVRHIPPAPDLPILPVANNGETPVFRRLEAYLPGETWKAVVAAGRERGLSPAALTLAAFTEAIGVWAASPRFTVNVTQFNREPIHRHVDRVVGSFTGNTLVDVDLAHDASFAEFARGVQRRIWEGLEHRAMSGVSILRELQRVQGSGQMPIVFTFVHSGDGDFRTRLGALGTVAYAVSQTPQVTLDCQVSESGDGLNIWWDADERAFADGGLEQELLGCFTDLLSSLADSEAWQTVNPGASPGTTLALRRTTETTAPVPAASLWDLVTQSAQARPDAVAVIDADLQVTYTELAAAARELAARLHRSGANGLVAIYVERGWGQLAAILGVLGAGCAYLPVDSLLPAERVRRLLELGEVDLVVTDTEIPSGPWTAIPVTVTGAADPLDLKGPSANDLAYVIFTSGSTGEPKGVRLRHGAVVNTILDVNRRFEVGAEDRVLALSSVGFDLSVWDVLGTLAAGGTVVATAPGQAAKDPVRWLAQLRAQRISVWNSAPALMEMLVTEAENRRVSVPDLRLVMLSGDWIPLDLTDRVRRIAPHARVVSLGGATEAAIWSVFYEIGVIQPGWASVPYGFPLTNQTLTVTDWAGRERPVGAVGELVIGGRGVADGYWKAPTLTDAAFPVGAQGLVYRTGDQVRRHADGVLEFLGRTDGQVKIQGHRVELGEIDAALVRLPGVRAAVTEAVGPRDGHRRLISVVVGHEQTLSGQALHDDLVAILPPYLVPSRILVRTQLPTTSNGKIDRAAVRKLAEATDAPTPTAAVSVGAGRSDPLTRHVLDVVREHVGNPDLGLHDDLLLAGMDSIHMVRLSGELERDLDFRPPLEEMLRTPTVATVVELYEQDIVARLRSGQRFGRLQQDMPVVSDPAQRELLRAGIERRPRAPVGALRIPLADLPFEDGTPLGRLLRSALPRLSDGGATPEKPVRSYLTPGGIAAVRLYLWLRAETRSLGRGLYVLDPLDADLVLLDPDTVISGDAFDPFVYRPVFERSPFAVFLVADREPYGALYGPEGARFAAMEAGALTQVVRDAMQPVMLRTVPLIETERLGEPAWDANDEVLSVLILDSPTATSQPLRADPATRAQPDRISRPLTGSELGLWMFTRRVGPSPTYNITGIFGLDGRLDTNRFADAARHVVRRHPALRSATDTDLPLMYTWPETDLDVPVTSLPAGASDTVVTQLIEGLAEGPFDIHRPPLLRATLLRRSATEHIAVLTVHHLVADDESMRIIGEEILTTYDGLSRPGWSVPPASTGDVATMTAQRGELVGTDPGESTRRRQSLLRTARVGDRLPSGPGGGRSWEGESRSVQLTAAEEQAWERARRDLGVTTQVLELGLLALAVRAAGGPDETLVGMPDFGRDSTADWAAVGYFATTLLLRVSLRDVSTVGELMSELRAEAGSAQAAKYLPTEDLAAQLAEASAGGFRLWLATYGEPVVPPMRDLQVKSIATPSRIARHDLRVGVLHRSDRLTLQVTHRLGVLEPEFLERFSVALTELHRCVPPAHRIVEAVLDEVRNRYPSPRRETPMTEINDADLLREIRSSTSRRRRARGAGEAVRLTLPRPGETLPIPVFEARLPGVDLGDWIQSAHERVLGLLHEHGAVLIRGTAGIQEGFPAALELMGGGELLDYFNRSTPRTRVKGNVFTSSEYPAEHVIPQHGEQAYTTRWPLVLGFHCEVAPQVGGQTPLASAAAVLAALPADLAGRFGEQGVLYERWYHPHVDLPWTEVFQTDDPDEMEAAAAAVGIETAWRDGVLRTRERAQGVVKHPVTGQHHWFNQAHLFHPAALPEVTRAELGRSYGDRLPRNAYFGDGQPIPDADIALIRGAIQEHTWSFPWQQGDVMLVDNLAMTHGRNSFTGPRRVLVAMAGTGRRDGATGVTR